MNEDDSDSSRGTANNTQTGETDVAHQLQMAVLDYLLVNGQKDPSLLVRTHPLMWQIPALAFYFHWSSNLGL